MSSASVIGERVGVGVGGGGVGGDGGAGVRWWLQTNLGADGGACLEL
jgi:hypothetical protein